MKEGRTSEDNIEITKACGSTVATSRLTSLPIKSQKDEFEKLLILLSEKKISLPRDIPPSLGAVVQAHRPLPIIAEDVDSEALAACILSKLRSQSQVCAVKATGF